jgi:FkbM family methyltransferase
MLPGNAKYNRLNSKWLVYPAGIPDTGSEIHYMKVMNTIAQANLLPLWKWKLRVWDFEFVAPSLDRLAALFLHKFGFLGKPDKLFFERNLRPGMNVVDIGANQGLYSLLFSRLAGETGVVISFEPEPDMFAALETNISTNSIKNVEAHCLALGSKSTEAMLSRSLVNAGDNRLTSGHSDDLSTKKLVRIVTLDEIVDGRKIDFIKMDIQGWEWEAIRGMTGTLDRNQTIGIHFEFWPVGLRRAGCEPLELLRFLLERGFHIYRHSGNREVPVENFSLLLSELTKNQFANLYAKRR